MVILVVLDVAMGGFVVVNICPVVLFGFMVTLLVMAIVSTQMVLVSLMI